MANLDDVLRLSAAHHHHLCPRQVLGARMGLLAGAALGLDVPSSDKRLLTIAETDGCAVDGISAATGCYVGRRSLRVVDFGKVAATFIDTRTELAVRIHPHPRCRQAALEAMPHARSRWHAQLEAYRLLPDEALLVLQPVELTVSLARLLSRPGARVGCEACGEEILNEREVVHEGMTLCRGCLGEAYYAMAPVAAMSGVP